ncbi:hypothetical protein [Halarchaeum sp. P4]
MRLDVTDPDIVPVCSACETPGTQGTHKGADVLRCPDCEDILYRPLAGR